MEYRRFDPSGCNFPPPRIPMLPAFAPGVLLRRHRGASPFRMLDTGPRGSGAGFFTRARYALLEAYRQAGVGPEGALLAPAYHCRTMIDPAVHLGAPVLLYGMTEELQPDLVHLEHCIAQSPQPVKAVLLPHYFGFAQPMAGVVRLCRAHGLALIEDCSHLLVTGAPAADPARPSPGQLGQWAVASPYKVYACQEGGLLWSNLPGQPASLGLQASPLREARALVRALRAGLHGGRVPAAARLDDATAAEGRRAGSPGCDTTVSDAGVSPAFVPAEAGLRGAPWARWVMRRSSAGQLAERRRAHYLRLHETVSALPHCRPLFDALPPDTVPYMFPLVIEHPAPHFYMLKRLGVAVGRWDDMAVSHCPVASGYRLHLIHLPCHQMLTDAQVNWMCRALETALKQPVRAP